MIKISKYYSIPLVFALSIACNILPKSSSIEETIEAPSPSRNVTTSDRDPSLKAGSESQPLDQIIPSSSDTSMNEDERMTTPPTVIEMDPPTQSHDDDDDDDDDDANHNVNDPIEPVAGVQVIDPCLDPNADPTERCDGVDNDCDGQIDERYVRLGESCSVGTGACKADGELTCATDENSLTCNAEALSSSAEQCDSIDNDCDGAVDEGLSQCCTTGETRVCGEDNGACQEGVKTCLMNQEWSQCEGEIAPVLELCDGIDNDCDERVDEGTLSACGTCDAPPIEVCDGGDNDCDGRIDEGTRNACNLCGTLPNEVCDGIDQDCDGRIDEGLLNACGNCETLPTERCDGIDQDCDGRTDENFNDANICSLGEGICRVSGLESCINGALVCALTLLESSVESCDGTDEDCDGAIDEGDICTEQCDGLDNDGDLTIDEGVLNACGACGSPPDEICDQVDNDCDGQVDEGVLNRCGLCGPEPDERCNQQDDDCDGSIDETFDTLGQSCTIGEGICQREGTWICAPRAGLRVICSSLTQSRSPEDEVCNGKDDDCDGSIDEDFDFSGLQHCRRCNNYCYVRADSCGETDCMCGDGYACDPGYECFQGRCRVFNIGF